MVLSKRERIIAVVAAVAFAALVLDHYALTPLLESGALMEARRAAATAKLQQSITLFRRQKAMSRRWNEMIEGGLMSDPAEAEGQVLHALQGWANEAGLVVTSMKPERAPTSGELPEITVQISGTGPMRAVSRFLYQVQTARFPLRIRDMQLGTRQEGADDLTLQLRVSTLYLSETALSARPAGKPRGEVL